MSILISWAGMILHDWFMNVIKAYLTLTRSSIVLEHFHRNNIEVGKLVWTNENRYWSYDYELFYKKFDTIIYIIRDPIDAMYTHYFWGNGLFEHDFFLSFVDYHLTQYAEHIKAHSKIATVVISFEKLVNDADYFMELIRYFDDNIDENGFKTIHSSLQPLLIDLKIIPQDVIIYIKNKWSEFGFEWRYIN